MNRLQTRLAAVLLTAPQSRARIAGQKVAGVALLLTGVVAVLFLALVGVTRSAGVENGLSLRAPIRGRICHSPPDSRPADFPRAPRLQVPRR